MPDLPKISVIIPAYNAEATLAAALQSCIDQNYPDYEVIIVDNNSTDGTLALARELTDGQTNTTVIQEHQQGAAHARNAGAAVAGGRWLQFLDADDVLLPGKWQRQVALMKPGQQWLQGAFQIRGPAVAAKTVQVADDMYWALCYSGELGHLNANLFERATYLATGGMNGAMPDHEDYDLIFRLVASGVPYAVDEQVSSIYWRPEATTLSTSDGAGRARRRVALTLRVISHLQTHEPEYYAQKAASYRTALFRQIRRIATLDVEEGVATFQRHFPAGINGERLDAKYLPKGFFLYSVLGYSLTERMRYTLRKLK